MKKIKLFIPAAGKGSRAGLDYPKTLYKIHDKPILINILDICKRIDDEPILVASVKGQNSIISTLNNYNKKFEILIQKKPLGMADAILNLENSKFYHEIDDYLLIWSDLISPSLDTIIQLINLHFSNNYDLTIASMNNQSCYTEIIRNNGRIIAVNENRNKKKLIIGERDVGIFVINKKILKYLKAYKKKIFINNEYSFLASIRYLIEDKLKVEAFPIATNMDLKSFNSLKDLK